MFETKEQLQERFRAEEKAERVVLEAENARLTAALLELHGPPPGPLCRCVNCNDFKPCPGQALSGDDSALKEMLEKARDQAGEKLWEAALAITEANCGPGADTARGIAGMISDALEKTREQGREEVRANYNVIVKEELARFEQERDSLRDQLAEAERKRDEYLVQREDMWTKQKCDQLAAQVERLRGFLESMLTKGHNYHLPSKIEVPRWMTPDWAHTAQTIRIGITALLAETSEQSLAAVREQARKEALEEAAQVCEADAANLEAAFQAVTHPAAPRPSVAEVPLLRALAKRLRELAAQLAKDDDPDAATGCADDRLPAATVPAIHQVLDEMNRLTPEQAKSLVPDSEWGAKFEDSAQPEKEPE